LIQQGFLHCHKKTSFYLKAPSFMPEHGPGAIGGGSLTMLMKYLFLALFR